MTPEGHDWTVPASLRALLWWPPVAFVVALLNPSAAAVTIAVAGAALAVLGALGTTVGRRVAARHLGRDAPLTTGAEPAFVPLAPEQQAA